MVTPLKINRAMLARACDDAGWVWTHGDRVLYDLCRNHPGHTDEQAVVAKLWLIGRSYAASLERKRPRRDLTLTAFYQNVACRLTDSDIDEQLAALRGHHTLDAASASAVLDVHAEFVRLLRKDTGMAKRSLASKYLHFHCPDIVPIYDSVAEKTIRKALGGGRVPTLASSHHHDCAYGSYIARFLRLRSQLEERFGASLSPRHLDRVLLSAEDAERMREARS